MEHWRKMAPDSTTRVRSLDDPPRSLEELKDMFLKSWCEMAEDIFRRIVESVPEQVQVVLAEIGDLSNKMQVKLK